MRLLAFFFSGLNLISSCGRQRTKILLETKMLLRKSSLPVYKGCLVSTVKEPLPYTYATETNLRIEENLFQVPRQNNQPY